MQTNKSCDIFLAGSLVLVIKSNELSAVAQSQMRRASAEGREMHTHGQLSVWQSLVLLVWKGRLSS